MSTQLILFALTHWQKHLGTDNAKGSAALLFDQIITQTLKAQSLVMVIGEEVPTVSIPQSGFRLHHSMGMISNASELCDQFAIIGKAIKNKKHRVELLDDQHIGLDVCFKTNPIINIYDIAISRVM